MSPTFTLRHATAEDAPTIRALVWGAKLNPSGVKWPRFVVAVIPNETVPPTEQVIACGQVKLHIDGSQELASIVVASPWRGQGIAHVIIEHLLVANPGDMYLMCLSSLGPFYEKFGFVPIGEEGLTPYFRRMKRTSRLIEFWMPEGESLLFMHRRAN